MGVLPIRSSGVAAAAGAVMGQELGSGARRGNQFGLGDGQAAVSPRCPHSPLPQIARAHGYRFEPECRRRCASDRRRQGDTVSPTCHPARTRRNAGEFSEKVTGDGFPPWSDRSGENRGMNGQIERALTSPDASRRNPTLQERWSILASVVGQPAWRHLPLRSEQRAT